MNDLRIDEILVPGYDIAGEKIEQVIETHISWVLLCRNFVYKVKKPVKLSFVDFSTLALRKKFCEREIDLNRRLAASMYLKVVSINRGADDPLVLAGDGEVIEYAVKMKRIDNDFEMRKMLKKGKVNEASLIDLAKQVAHFHASIEQIRGVATTEDLLGDFSDILQIQDFTIKRLGSEFGDKLEGLVKEATDFLEGNASAIANRSRSGMIRDCHGDLHSGNIFLTDPPIIFDCIEFNDHFRQIDILNEVAFFCMDLEFYQRQDLAKIFMNAYIDEMQIRFGAFEQRLFLFYKFYRANVKTKVNAIKSMQEQKRHDKKDRGSLFEDYFKLMVDYGNQLRPGAR
ncbi:MAG: phosphotransferase [Saprospiraceae bacterium]|nr:phosphotransferase [Saprospiraceae bacterium]